MEKPVLFKIGPQVNLGHRIEEFYLEVLDDHRREIIGLAVEALDVAPAELREQLELFLYLCRGEFGYPVNYNFQGREIADDLLDREEDPYLVKLYRICHSVTGDSVWKELIHSLAGSEDLKIASEAQLTYHIISRIGW